MLTTDAVQRQILERGIAGTSVCVALSLRISADPFMRGRPCTPRSAIQEPARRSILSNDATKMRPTKHLTSTPFDRTVLSNRPIAVCLVVKPRNNSTGIRHTVFASLLLYTSTQHHLDLVRRGLMRQGFCPSARGDTMPVELLRTL